MLSGIKSTDNEREREGLKKLEESLNHDDLEDDRLGHAIELSPLDIELYVHSIAPEGLNTLYCSVDEVVQAVRAYGSSQRKSLVLGRSTTDGGGQKNTQQFECCYSGEPTGPRSKKCGCKYFMWFGRFTAKLSDGRATKLWRLNSIHNQHSCPDLSEREYKMSKHQRFIPDHIKKIAADAFLASNGCMAAVNDAIVEAFPHYREVSQRTWSDSDLQNFLKKCKRFLNEKGSLESIISPPFPSSSSAQFGASSISLESTLAAQSLAKWKACIDLAVSSSNALKLLSKLNDSAAEMLEYVTAETDHRPTIGTTARVPSPSSSDHDHSGQNDGAIISSHSRHYVYSKRRKL